MYSLCGPELHLRHRFEYFHGPAPVLLHNFVPTHLHDLIPMLHRDLVPMLENLTFVNVLEMFMPYSSPTRSCNRAPSLLCGLSSTLLRVHAIELLRSLAILLLVLAIMLQHVICRCLSILYSREDRAMLRAHH